MSKGPGEEGGGQTATEEEGVDDGVSCPDKNASLTVCLLISTYSCQQHIGGRSMMGARADFE